MGQLKARLAKLRTEVQEGTKKVGAPSTRHPMRRRRSGAARRHAACSLCTPRHDCSSMGPAPMRTPHRACIDVALLPVGSSTPGTPDATAASSQLALTRCSGCGRVTPGTILRRLVLTRCPGPGLPGRADTLVVANTSVQPASSARDYPRLAQSMEAVCLRGCVRVREPRQGCHSTSVNKHICEHDAVLHCKATWPGSASSPPFER